MTGSLPDEMTYIDLPSFGGPDALVPARGPLPRPAAGEVLIKVAAAGVNRPDVMQREGNYNPPPGASPVPGLEIAGEVVALGDGVSDLQLGDKVCALVGGGGYAQYCVAPSLQCLPVPKGLSLLEAAALPENYFTVWTNVFERGGLKAGETILIHGGSSGIGTTAIQLAREFGARIFTTVGNSEKAQACLDLGAERAINYRDEDYVSVVKELTDGKGVDLILDMVGGDYIPRDIEALAIEGRLVQIAFQKPSKMEFDFLPMMLKRLTLTGSTLRPRSVEQKAAIAQALHTHVWPLLESGKVKPLIYETFPLEKTCDAHALMDSSKHIGKIMLDCQ
ncbi:NAD(P)H-quinone oxidoreductase [Roseovarius sp.]|uniref:NAD(P)H-quinone oxidoreductase n=1 Tax=Roseovarius sp. TaxID=1486281 RepID=UPI003A969754